MSDVPAWSHGTSHACMHGLRFFTLAMASCIACVRKRTDRPDAFRQSWVSAACQVSFPVLACNFNPHEREFIMSSTQTSITSRYARMLRPVVAMAAIAISATAVHAQTEPAQQPDTQRSQAKPGAEVEKAVSDSWITTKVKSEILANSVSKGFKVNVTTKSGVVALKGKLPTQDAVDLVKNLAQNVQGVQSVDASGLTVEAAS